MGHSQELRLREVRGAIRLVGEVRELGADWHAWRLHLLRRLGELVGGKAGVSCEHHGRRWLAERGTSLRGLVIYSQGGAAEERALDRFMCVGIPGRHEAHQSIASKLEHSFTHLRREAVSDERWYDPIVVEEVLRPAGVDDTVVSAVVLPKPGYVHALSVHREWGDKPFEVRHRKVIALVHSELEHLWQSAAAQLLEEREAGLPPRLRQTLERLVVGDSEKQIAHALGVSPHTVHHYVTELYRRYQVSCRAELVARHAEENRPKFIPRLTE